MIIPVPPGTRRRGRPRKVAAPLQPLDISIPAAVPSAYGYGRVSHDDQVDGESVPAQEARAIQFWEQHLRPAGVEWKGFFGEPRNVSAYKKRFEERAVGKFLMATMRPGDHLVVDKVDRLWRNVHDFSSLLQYLQRQQIRLHFVNFMGVTVTLGTPMGDFLLNMSVAFSQLESAVKSDRVKASFRHGAEQGYWKCGRCPVGTKTVGQRPRRRLVWDMQERRVMSEVVRLMDEERLSSEQASDRIEEILAAQEGRAPIPSYHTIRRKWDKRRIQRAYVYERHFRLVENPMDAPLKLLCTMSVWECRRRLGRATAAPAAAPQG